MAIACRRGTLITVITRATRHYHVARHNHDRDHLVACPACHAQAQDHDHACSRLARFLDVASHDNDHDRLATCLDVHLSKTPARIQGCSARQLNVCHSSWGPRQHLAVHDASRALMHRLPHSSLGLRLRLPKHNSPTCGRSLSTTMRA
jgi:hypothetical protein